MRYRKTIMGLTLALGAWLIASACVEDTPAMFIVHNAALDADCDPVRTASGDTLSTGVMDLTVARTYRMQLLVENLLSPSGANTLGASAGGVYEGNRITFTSAIVSIIGPSAGLTVALPENQELAISGTLEPGGGSVVEFDAITQGLGEQLAAQLTSRDQRLPVRVNVQFVGQSTSGAEVESNVFTYPLTICRGCLLNFPADAVNPLDEPPNCGAEVTDSTTVPEPCRAGQDEAFDCRICRNILETRGADQATVNAQCEPIDAL